MGQVNNLSKYREAVLSACDLIHSSSRVVCFDTETTGFGNDAEIIEFSAIDLKSGAVLLDTLIRPSKPLPPKIVEITNITDQMLVKAPAFPQVAGSIKSILDESIWVAYNASFDVRMILQNYQIAGQRYSPSFFSVMDAMKIVANVIQYPGYNGSFKWVKLGEAQKYFNLPTPEGALHRAVTDTRLMRDIIYHISRFDIEQVPV